jgi:hypothetical protein
MPQQRQPAASHADLTAHFEPLRRARPPARRLALLTGSVMWLIALLVLGLVIRGLDVVGIAVAAVAGSIAIGVLASSWMRVVRLREERDG